MEPHVTRLFFPNYALVTAAYCHEPIRMMILADRDMARLVTNYWLRLA